LPDHFHSQSPGARLVLETILSHGRAPYMWRPSRITKSGNPIVVPTFSHAISAKNLTLNRPSYFVRERLRHSQSVVSRPWWNARRPERPALTRKSTRTCCGIAAVTNWRMTASIPVSFRAILATNQSSRPSDTPSWRRRALRAYSEIETALVQNRPLRTARYSALCAGPISQPTFLSARQAKLGPEKE
jgi:hypothetical protein